MSALRPGLVLLARRALASSNTHMMYQLHTYAVVSGVQSRSLLALQRTSEALSSSALEQQFRRFASEGAATADDATKQAPQEEASASNSQAAAEGEQGIDRTIDELEEELKEREASLQAMQAQVTELTDSFKRSLAEMENLRQRTTRQVEQANKFAAQSFAKGMLDVADNLQRAAESVPPEVLQEGADVDRDRALQLLRGLLEGVQLTNNVLLQVFKQNGLSQFDPTGDKFDPNLHNAMFEVPDPSKEPGTVAMVTKRGYMFHDRVLRAAECGVVRAA